MFEEMESRLERIQDNLDKHLVFAEAKNATNLAFVIAVFSTLAGNKQIPVGCSYVLLVIMLFLSGLFSVVSFIPQMRSRRRGKKIVCSRVRNIGDTNLMYFKTICCFTGQEYLDELANKYHIKKPSFPNYALDLSDEIVYISWIVKRKFVYFRLAVSCDLLVLVLWIWRLVAA